MALVAVSGFRRNIRTGKSLSFIRQKERTMSRFTRLFAILLLTGVSGFVIADGKSKEEITFKGIQFDKSGEMKRVKQMCLDTPAERDVVGVKIQQRYPINCVAEPNSHDYGLDQISFTTSYGSLEGDIRFSKGQNDSLIGVSIFASSAKIVTLVPALTAKYGAPRVNPVLLEMINGTKVTRDILTWIDSRGTLMTLNPAAESLSAKADLRYGRLSIESARLRAIKAKMKDADTSAIKDNL